MKSKSKAKKEPVEKFEDDEFVDCEISGSDEDTETYAIINRRSYPKVSVPTWRAWLKFLATELRSELYEQVPDKYLEQLESDFDDIMRFINMSIAGEDRFFLDEKYDCA